VRDVHDGERVLVVVEADLVVRVARVGARVDHALGVVGVPAQEGGRGEKVSEKLEKNRYMEADRDTGGDTHTERERERERGRDTYPSSE
jgi:hypothetical protein